MQDGRNGRRADGRKDGRTRAREDGRTEERKDGRLSGGKEGRSGRQGDPGESIFFVSLEDDLMRIFGSEKLQSMLSTLGLKKGEVIEHKRR